MAKLIYSAVMSLDGYVADKNGDFNWTGPDEEVAVHIFDRESRIGTYLFGRRLYETMAVWETPELLPSVTPAILKYAEIWRAADKIVYSTTLESVSTARTRLERAFDADAVRTLKAEATRDIEIGGSELAAHAIRAGLVDEYNLLIAPNIIGGGTPYLPDDVTLKLELLDERRFGNGMVYVRYRPEN